MSSVWVATTDSPRRADRRDTHSSHPASARESGLYDTEKLLTIFRQPRNALHFQLIHNQHHEHIVRNVPLAPYAVATGGLEPKTRVILGVTQNNDKRATNFPKFLIRCFDQFSTDPPALIFREHRHWPQARLNDFPSVRANGQRAIQDVTDHVTIQGRDQR
jgi:hypothetical protein